MKKKNVSAALALTAGLIVAAAAGAVRAEQDEDEIEVKRKICLSLAINTSVEPETAKRENSGLISVEPQIEFGSLISAESFEFGSLIGGLPNFTSSRHCYVVKVRVVPHIKILEEPGRRSN